MTDPDAAPIVVNPDQTAAQFGVALRYCLAIVGGYLVNKGWLSGDALEMLTTLALTLGPVAYAAYRSHQQKKALVTVAAAAPNDVAVIKGVSA